MAKNDKHFCMCITRESLSAADKKRMRSQRAALLKSAQWADGSLITVRFLEGDARLQKRVRDMAMEWTKIANISFDFREQGPTDLRIGFKPGNGSWSYLGTLCRQVPEPQPTMNYGWLTPTSSDSELQRVVLHEFGHALGLIHEHQNPKKAIKWNRDAVIHDLSGPPNNWDEAKINNNMFKFYEPKDVTATETDPESIMMYPIPGSWTRDGFSAGLNSKISKMDKILITNVYPK